MELAFPVSQNGIQRALLTQSLIAHNLANLTTAGFKAVRALGGTFRVPGTQVTATQPDMATGPLKETNRELDLAIAGEGFFVLEAGDRQAYTRSGNFHVDEEGTLVTTAGFPLEGGITVPPDAVRLSVTRTGEIFAVYASGEADQIGQLQIARFPNPAGLLPSGDNIYVEGPDSGDALLVTPGEEGAGAIYQGFVEQANVDEATEITNQLINQRHFQVNLRTFQAVNDMVGRAVDLTR